MTNPWLRKYTGPYPVFIQYKSGYSKALLLGEEDGWIKGIALVGEFASTKDSEDDIAISKKGKMFFWREFRCHHWNIEPITEDEIIVKLLEHL